MANYRIEKVNALIQEVLAELIAREFCESREVIISLTRVDASGNLQEAKVYVSVLPDQKQKSILGALNKRVQFFQAVLNRKLNMRPVPRIIFVADSKPQDAQAVETILEGLKEDGH